MLDDISISEMQAMQKALWERNREKWSPLEPRYARDSILWMMEELGEVISLIKKKEEAAITSEPQVRAAFVEELADVLMYYNDVLMRYGISAGELGNAYRRKHQKNMGRDFEEEYAHLLEP